jgi:hypothetical protein
MKENRNKEKNAETYVKEITKEKKHRNQKIELV